MTQPIYDPTRPFATPNYEHTTSPPDTENLVAAK